MWRLMLVISLTTIPPRFATLPRVLSALLDQGADRVMLWVPERYARFPGPVALPPLPEAVTVTRLAGDPGPAAKLLPAARALRGSGARIVCCDDDWIYGPGWLAALRAVSADVVAGSVFGVERLKRQGPGVIAQGFAGVRIAADAVPEAAFDVPEAAWAVDDIWLSGVWAAHGLEVAEAPAARGCMTPLPGDGLQDAVVAGRSRAQANSAACDAVAERFGIWGRV